MTFVDSTVGAAGQALRHLLERPYTRMVPILVFICLVYALSTGFGGLTSGLGGIRGANAQEVPNSDPVIDDVGNNVNDLFNDNPVHQGVADPAPAVDTPPNPPPSQRPKNCRPFVQYAGKEHPPFSSGAYNLSFQRPMPPECRTFRLPDVDATIERLKNVISDPDLYRLFENSFPNTLDTTVKFKGYAEKNGKPTDEELTFVITGDINAMWLRDSANQMASYLSLLKADSSADSLASLYRGVINLQARYILSAPFCNSFQAPDEAKLTRTNNQFSDRVMPHYDPTRVWECKYEIDSLAAFLQISTHYHNATGDTTFFGRHQWAEAVEAVLATAEAMQPGTRGPDGRILRQGYTFTRQSRWGDSLLNGGKGSPVRGGTGLIRSAFRPSDDACIYQLFIPGNMMFSRYLASAAEIMRQLRGRENLATQMETLAHGIRAAIEEWGVIEDKEHGRVYAYEVDGFGSVNMMDDANIPSLLSAPLYGYLNASDTTYQNTRRKLLSKESAYYSRGPVINAMGGPHDGPGRAWPMARIVQILTTDDEDEIVEGLGELVSSTAGLGLIHESIDTFDDHQWSRQWFSWANGLFGQMILDLEKRKPEILKKCFQPDCLKKDNN